MSSEISRIDRCTGSALSCFAITSPKARPSAQTPRNGTLPRSGSTRLASPPPWPLAASTRDWVIEERFMACPAPCDPAEVVEYRPVAQDCATGRKKGARILPIRKGFWQADGAAGARGGDRPPRRGANAGPPRAGRAPDAQVPVVPAAVEAPVAGASSAAKFTLK